MQKILEIKAQDWAKGLSTQTGSLLGGLFQTSNGFNPFEMLGFLQPSLSATELTAPATNPIKNITSYQSGGTSYVLGQSNTKLYQYLRESPYTQVDLSSKIAVGTVKGAIFYKGYYVYATEDAGVGTVRASDLSSADAEILSGVNFNGIDRPMCVGADLALYVGNANAVDKATVMTATGAPNVDDKFSLEIGMRIRDLCNDGRNLVIFADNNNTTPTSRVDGDFRCRVYFWDMIKTTADVIWDIPGEAYIIGAKFVDGVLVIFGYNGIYVCNVVTPPRQIASFLGNSTLAGKRPTSPYQISVGGNVVYWADGSTNGQNIYAYGSLFGSNKIFFSPYVTHSSTYAHNAIAVSGGRLFASVDAPKFYVHNVGTTRGNATLTSCPIILPQPFTYGYAKVVLKNKLSSGQSVSFSAFTAGGLTISDSDTKTYSASNPRKNLKFDRKAITGGVNRMEDIYFTINPQGGAVVERVAIYGEPTSDADQDL